jgi:hypothetical protein
MTAITSSGTRLVAPEPTRQETTYAPYAALSQERSVHPPEGASETTTDVSLFAASAPHTPCTSRLSGDIGYWLLRDLSWWRTEVATLPASPSWSIAGDDLTPSRAIDLLRAWTGLPVTDLADLLGVARRSVYHWSTGEAKPRRQTRLLGVVRALEPLARSWQSWEFRDWLLTPEVRALVQAAPVEDLSRQVEEAVASRSFTRLRQAQPAYRQEVVPLGIEAIGRHLAYVNDEINPRALASRREPRELVVAPQLEEE